MSASAIEVRALRNAFGAFTTGVTIVTTRDEKEVDVGMTANSFSSVSLDPPMVLWSLARTSSSFAAFHESKYFAVHILSATQETLSTRFATRGADRFAGASLSRGPGEIPLLEGCSARFVCRTRHRHEGGDHVIFVGEVLDFSHGDQRPLVFHAGRYGALLPRDATPLETVGPGTGLTSGDILFHISRLFYDLRQEAVRERARRDWSEAEYGVLNSLGREDNQSLDALTAEVGRRGRVATPEVMLSLVNKDLVEVEGAAGPAMRVRLTARGRQSMIEIVALLKSAEAEALAPLDGDEVGALRNLLSRVGSAR